MSTNTKQAMNFARAATMTAEQIKNAHPKLYANCNISVYYGGDDTMYNFDVLARWDSYATPMGMLVRNKHTGRCEYWENNNDYSSTTQRHKAVIRGELYGHVRPSDIYNLDTLPQGYFAPTLKKYGRGCVECCDNKAVVTSRFFKADRPRIQRHTRRNTLVEAAALATRMQRILVVDIPKEHHHDKAVEKLAIAQYYAELAEKALRIEDIDEMRTFVRSIRVLEG